MLGRDPISFILSTATVLAYLIPGAFAALSYQRSEILDGHYWRLLTGHLTHGSASHLIWNLAAFIILGRMAERKLARAYPLFLAGSSLLISLGLLAFLPRLRWYCGLSGVDMALFGYLLLDQWAWSWRKRDRLLMGSAVLLTIGLLGKIAYEFLYGRMLFVHAPDLPPVPAAHLLGLFAGTALFCAARPTRP